MSVDANSYADSLGSHPAAAAWESWIGLKQSTEGVWVQYLPEDCC